MNKMLKKLAITEFQQLDLSGYYIYADYLTWQFKERVELFNGQIIKKGPNPGPVHQMIVGQLLVNFSSHFKKMYSNESERPQAFTYLDVRLPMPDKQILRGDTVVQPDILVVLDKNKFDELGCNGCPDLVIEVLHRLEIDEKVELNIKFDTYQLAGVSEYWIIDPIRKIVIIYTLNKKGKYIGSPFYTSGQQVISKVIKGFNLDVDLIFPE